jgi:endonuclease/exonuclease/phosphatase family metal-dependent hydrolase
MKLMTYNILNGGVGREQAILEVISSVQPDVVVLQEVFEASFLDNLGVALNMQPFWVNGNRKRRVALLSRLPILSLRSHHPVFPIWNNVIEASVEYQPGKVLKVFGVHKKADLAIIFEWRRWLEAGYILELTRSHRKLPCLITGDFNAIGPGDTIITARMPSRLKLTLWLQGNRAYRFSIKRYLKAGFTDAFRAMNPADEGFTLPTPRPNSRLDYILVNNALRSHVKQCWVVREPPAVEIASDHFPIVAEFEW